MHLFMYDTIKEPVQKYMYKKTKYRNIDHRTISKPLNWMKIIHCLNKDILKEKRLTN